MVKKLSGFLIAFTAALSAAAIPSVEPGFEIRGLLSGTAEKKIEIIERIMKTGDKVYLPELAALLEVEENREIRSRAAQALLRAGDSTCVPAYTKALGDSYWQVRLYAIQGLVRYGEGEMIPDFKKAAGDSYWQVRYYGIAGLAKYGDESVIPFLISSLKDEHEDVRGKALWALFSLMWKDSARSFFKGLDDTAVKPVLDAAGSSNPEIRIRTLWLLEASGDERAVPLFIKMLEDKNDEIKIRALWAIERFKSEEGNRQIESLILDDSTQVRIESIKTLVRLKASESISGLVRGLSDSDERVRIYSLWAMEKFRDPASYPAIAEKLDDASGEVREYARILIENLKDPAFFPVLQRMAEDAQISRDARLAALKILGSIGDESLKPFMMEKTRDASQLFRYGALEALFNIDRFDADFISLLAYLERHDNSARVRRQANLFLREIISGLQVKLESGNKEDREFALSRIESLYGTRNLVSLLLKMAYSKYPEVREKMLLAAKDLPDKVFAKSLHDLFKEPDINIKKLAAFAMGETGDRDSIPLLKEGMRHFDPEFQLICAWALAKMGISEAYPFGARYLRSSNIEYQKLAAEIFLFLSDPRSSSALLKSLLDSELEIKLISARALAGMGEEKGLETLVRLSEEGIEPIRTGANLYLQDKAIPLSLRAKIPALREKIRFEKLGIQEVGLKRVDALKAKAPVKIDGSDGDRFWKTAAMENAFILLEGDRVPSGIQTRVAAGYDSENLYFLLICEDPGAGGLDLNSRDFMTISLNPLNSDEKWYQFVVHPFGDIKYSYVWKLYVDDEAERNWVSEWKAAVKIEKSRWVAEISIPLADLQADKVFSGDKWGVNFQRDSLRVPPTTWTGRIDNPSQFGIIHFRE